MLQLLLSNEVRDNICSKGNLSNKSNTGIKSNMSDKGNRGNITNMDRKGSRSNNSFQWNSNTLKNYTELHMVHTCTYRNSSIYKPLYTIRVIIL